MQNRAITLLLKHCQHKLSAQGFLAQHERCFMALMHSKKPIECYYFSTVLNIMNYAQRLGELENFHAIPIRNEVYYVGKERRSKWWIEGIHDPNHIGFFEKLINYLKGVA